jgi:PleD family two-component response regulator
MRITHHDLHGTSLSITVLLVDEHTFKRKGIRACIAENSAYRVIGEASSAATALADLQGCNLILSSGYHPCPTSRVCF